MGTDAIDFSGVKQFIRGALYEGKFKVHSNGVSFKNESTGKVDQISPSDIKGAKWMRVAFFYELQLITKSKSVVKYDGFRETDFEPLKAYFSDSFGISLKKQDLSVKGWNHGQVKFENDQMCFLVDEKPSFEIPLRNVTKCDTPGKNEVAIEFHQNDDADIELVEMRFWVPNSADAEVDLVTDFHDKVMASADILSATGTAIMSFEEVNCSVPKGRHEIKFYPTCIQMRGKTNVWIVQYTSILRLFLLPHNDGNQIFFVVSLDPPLKQGATRYHFVICQFHKDEEVEQELKLSEEEIKEKYENKVDKVMNGLTYEVFSRGMKAFSNRKITVPGSFKGDTDKPSIFCGYKSNTGYLYPLERGFLYVPRPPLHIRFDEIAHVNFARGTGTLRSFDIEITTKHEQSYTFSQIERGEYNKLFDFVKQKNIAIKNIGDEAAEDTDSDLKDSDESESEIRGGDQRPRGRKGHDPYLEKVKKEGREREARGDSSSEEDDSDFAPLEVEDVAEEYDSHAEYVTSDEEEGADNAGNEKKKKERRIASTISEPGFEKKSSKSAGGANESSTSGGSKRRKKEARDPNAPKKPASAYFIFVNEERSNIKAKNPDAKVTDVSKIAGEMWKELSAEQKQVYLDKATKLKEEYNALVASMPKAPKSAKKGVSRGASASSSSAAAGSKVSSSQGASSAVKSKEFISSDESSSSDASEETKKKKKQAKTEKKNKTSKSSPSPSPVGKEVKEEDEEEDEDDDDEEEEDVEDDAGDEDEDGDSKSPAPAKRSTRGRGGAEPLAEGLPEDGEDEEEFVGSD